MSQIKTNLTGESQLLAEIAAQAPELSAECVADICRALLSVYRTADAAVAGLRRGAVDIQAERALA